MVEDEEAVSLAFLVLLERLDPDERAVLVLREAFDYAVRRDRRDRRISVADDCRQILSRARRRVADERAALRPRPGRAARARRALPRAAREGDIEGLVAMLAPDAVLVGDGGGKARSIPRRCAAPPAGRPRARRPSTSSADAAGASTLEPAVVNGQPGLPHRSRPTGGSSTSSRSTIDDGRRPAAIYSMLNPDKLGHLGLVVGPRRCAPTTPRDGRGEDQRPQRHRSGRAPPGAGCGAGRPAGTGSRAARRRSGRRCGRRSRCR